MFSKILKLESLDDVNYKDVNESHWAYEYVQKTCFINLMSSRTEDEFFPDSYLTKREFAIVLSNYAKLQGFELSVEVKEDVFDISFIDEGFREIHEMLNVKILSTVDNIFYPEDFINRDEAVRVINKIIDRNIQIIKNQTFTDVIPTDNYYKDIEAAVNGI